MSKSIKLYGGDVILHMDEDAHCYSFEGRPDHPPGVTAILKVLDKPALVGWAANCPVEHISNGYKTAMEGPDGVLDVSAFLSLCQEAKTAYRKISKEARDVGSLVHKFAEQVLVDRRAAMPSDPQAAKGAAAFLSWFNAHKIEPFCVERIVFSKTWYYAGTCDFFGKIDDEICVLDFKSSNPFKNKWHGPYIEMHLQLAAYAVAITEETGERIDAGWIVRLDKQTGQCDPHRIELHQGWKNAWLRVRETYEAINKLEDQLNGIRQRTAA